MLNILKNKESLNDNVGAVLVKYRYLVALGICIIHLLFKCHGMAGISFWFDEAYSVYWSGHEVSEIIEESLKNDPNPPLYVSLLHYWVKMFGDSEWGVRLFSAFTSSLAGSVLFLFCMRFFNWQAAVFASMMYFTSYELYFYGVEARTFSILILFTLLAYQAFLGLLQKPRLLTAVLLAVLNAGLIYLHLLAGIILIGEVILFPLLALRQSRPRDEAESKDLRFVVSRKLVILFLLSFVLCAALLWPWVGRLLEYSQNGIKNFWLQKPTSKELKECIYDFFNSKGLFNAYLFSFLGILLLVLCFKKLRQYPLSTKLLIFALIVGPGLIFLNYFLAGYIPIFLKRYVLFTLLGFILLFAYVLSLLRVNFFVKLAAFVVLSFFSFQKMVYPRPSFYDYDKLASLLHRVKAPDTFMTNDLQDLVSYYYAKDIFYEKAYHLKHNYLLERGLYTPFNLTWPETEHLEKYRFIYHTQTFDYINDPEKKVEKALLAKFKRVAHITEYKGITVDCYYNPYPLTVNKDENIEKWKLEIFNHKDWLKQVALKAKSQHIPVDSMVTLDAIWALQHP